MYIKLLSMHRKETDSNKRLASALVEKWSRPIFNSTVNFRAQDVQEVVPRFNAKELAAQAEETDGQGGGGERASDQACRNHKHMSLIDSFLARISAFHKSQQHI